jgi:hypothetical protein
MSSLIHSLFSRWFVFLLGGGILLAGCADPNDQAPGTNQAHPSRFIVLHAADAADNPDGCRACHGSDLTGAAYATSCYQCHQQSDPIVLHPLPYDDPAAHGADAMTELHRCFGCHGSPPNVFDGGILSDPDLFNRPAADCSSSGCHPDAGAHPTRWQGDNDITGGYSASHRFTTREVIDAGCALCHQVTLGGPQPQPQAPSCFAAGFTNAQNDTSACHPGGFSPAHPMPFTDPDDHGRPAKADLDGCQECHGTPGTIAFDGGTASTACSSAGCHPDAGAHPTNWQGRNDIGSAYVSTHRNASVGIATCGICHDVNRGRTPPNPSAPSCYSGSFTNSDDSTSNCHSGGPGD